MIRRLATLGLLLVACGGEDRGPRPDPTVCRPLSPLSDTPDPGSGPADCHALDGLEIFVIDSFEVGRATPGWYINNDRTALSDPLPDTDPVPASAIPGGRCVDAEASDDAPRLCASRETPRGECDEPLSLESRSALHIRTGNLSTGGGVLGHNFPKEGCIDPLADDPSTQCPYRPGPPEVGPCSVGMGPSPPYLGCEAVDDTSDWDGVVLWARKAPGSQSSVRVRLSDVRTDEAACICNPFTSQNDTSDGCDKFGMFATLDGTFRAYLLPFELMQQGGWGISSPHLDTHELMSIGLEYGRGAWDIWVDDVGFYRRPR